MQSIKFLIDFLDCNEQCEELFSFDYEIFYLFNND